MAGAQNWATPPEFIEAIARRFGRPDFDLAATSENTKAPAHFTERDDSLKRDWVHLDNGESERVRTAFCNPPFASIAPWVEKAAACKDLPRWTLLLLPASVDSNWFDAHVHNHAHWLGLKGRIKFVGADSTFMKPLMLACYGFGMSGSSPWDWRQHAQKAQAAE